MAHILVVDDDEGVRSFITEALELRQHRVTTAESGEEALDKLQCERFDLLITDLKMPGQGGMALLAKACVGWPRMGALVLTACEAAQYAHRASQLGAYGLLTKPIADLATFYNMVNRAICEASLAELEPPPTRI